MAYQFLGVEFDDPGRGKHDGAVQKPDVRVCSAVAVVCMYSSSVHDTGTNSRNGPAGLRPRPRLLGE